MSKSVFVYAALLAVGLGASWVRYTSDDTAPKEGVPLVEVKQEEVRKVVYDAPELDVTFEQREDAFGRHGWVTVAETKKKKEGDQETTELKTSRFKAGSAAEKLLTDLAPLMAIRELEGVDDAKLETFGLKAPETTVTIETASGTTTLELGGETYGTKDRYVRNRDTGRVYVVKDEAFKTLKFANTRLPEKQLVAAKPEEIETVALGQGGATASWTQKNREDKTAAYWEREGSGKDETFDNWFEKFSKVKATGFAQEGDVPADAQPAFDLTVRATGKPAETVRFLQAGDDWFATSESLRGTVKLPKSSAKDVADDVRDILEGRAPPEEPKAEKAPPGAPGHDEASGASASPATPPRPPGVPPNMPMPRPPGMPKAPVQK